MKTELDASFFIKSVILDEKDTPGLRCKKILGLYSHRNNDTHAKRIRAPQRESLWSSLTFARTETQAQSGAVISITMKMSKDFKATL